ncbi:MAG TPA: LEA type 2 family protein [Casimicrobiaceae bacterium]|nr:LEA type 2 family protein [Casimicrobiaceae bacterium]
MSSFPRRRFLAAGAALLAAACTSSRPKIEPPAITLDAVRVGRIAEAKADVSLKLTLANHNSFELPIDRIDFDVALDGRPAVSGRSVHVDPLPPGGEAKVDLAGRVDVAAVATALMTLGSQLPVPYSVSGTLTLRNGTALAFSRNGEIPVQRFDGAVGARP